MESAAQKDVEKISPKDVAETSIRSDSSKLDASSLLSEVQDPALSSYATIRSMLPTLVLPQKGTNKKSRKARKKVAVAAEQLSDEAKSIEYKAFEAFIMSNHFHVSLDDLDLTGQEDPVVLHAVIATLPSQTAYKEVQKFRRRPQYLEYFVHLANSTLSKGHGERVMEWCQDAFQWLKKRNDLLISPKQSKVGDQKKTTQKVKPVAAPQNSLVAKPSQSKMKQSSAVALYPEKGISQRSTTALATAKAAGGCKSGKFLGASLNVPRQPSRSKQLQPVVSRSLNVSHNVHVKITRDDVEHKAGLVLSTVLPELWRIHKSR